MKKLSNEERDELLKSTEVIALSETVIMYRGITYEINKVTDEEIVQKLNKIRGMIKLW